MMASIDEAVKDRTVRILYEVGGDQEAAEAILKRKGAIKARRWTASDDAALIKIAEALNNGKVAQAKAIRGILSACTDEQLYQRAHFLLLSHIDFSLVCES